MENGGADTVLVDDNVLVRHLSNCAPLRSDEKEAIDAVVAGPTKSVGARRDLIREGAAPHGVLLILSGWTCRYKMLDDGRRQIVSFLIPGDMCDLHNTVLARMDHSIGALSPVRYAALPNERLHQLSIEYPRVGRALWWQMLVNVAQQREWTMNIGQRSARERIGSLFCELFIRSRAIGLTSDKTFEFPATQADLAEATGLTSVHVNRTLQQLRQSELINLAGRVLTIPDLAKLSVASHFSPEYLHLNIGKAGAAVLTG